MKFTRERLEEILDKPELDKRGKNLVFKCPKCGEREAGISLEHEGNPWQCLRKSQCGVSGTIFTLLKYLDKLNLLGSLQVPEERKQVIKKIKMPERDRRKQGENIKYEVDLPTIIPPAGFKRIYEDEYLESRKFDQFNRYKVGVTEVHPGLKHDFIIFLIEQYGEVKGYIGRSRKSKEEIDSINKERKEKGLRPILRYNNSNDTDFSKLLFGYDEITENTTTIILVEGIFDKFRIDKLLELHSQEEVKCVCTFGCSVSDEQKYMLYQKHINIFILLYDGDVINKVKKVSLELDQEFDKVLVGFCPVKDPGDFENEDLDSVLENLESPSLFNLNKVHKRDLKVQKKILKN